jgi:hypothetical protein
MEQELEAKLRYAENGVRVVEEDTRRRRLGGDTYVATTLLPKLHSSLSVSRQALARTDELEAMPPKLLALRRTRLEAAQSTVMCVAATVADVLAQRLV